MKRREKDSSMCAAKHLLLWVLEPYMLPLGPRLNPREAKKSHWFLEAVLPHLASVNIREGGLFSCSFLPIKVKFFKIHLSCVNFIKTLIKYFTGVGESLEVMLFLLTPQTRCLQAEEQGIRNE